MKLLFIRPPMPIEMEKEEPLGILYLMTYLKNYLEDAEVMFKDLHILRWSEEQVQDYVKAWKPDFILVSCLTLSAYYVYNLIERIKETGHNALIIMGGPHATAMPEECIEAGADFCCLGEGELTLCELIHIIQKGTFDYSTVDNIVYKQDGKIIFTSRTHNLIDLSTLCFPDFTLLSEYESYYTHIHLLDDNTRALPIMASRGCFNNCPFCSSKLMWQRKLRYRPVSAVVDELEFDTLKYGIHDFHFLDDDFLENREFLRKFCNEINRRRLDIRFCCLSTVNSLLRLTDKELQDVIDAGLYVIEVGIESFIPEVLKYLKKSYTLEVLPMLIERVIRFKIDIRPLLMYLVPNETLSRIGNASKLLLDTIGRTPYLKKYWHLDNFTITSYASCFTRLPGTDFAEHAEELGMLIESDIHLGDTDRISFIPFSLLNDIPVKTVFNLIDIDQIVEKAEQCFSIPETLDCFHCLKSIWNKIDGKKSVKEIADTISIEEKADLTVPVVFIFVLLAEDHLVLSAKDCQKDACKVL